MYLQRPARGWCFRSALLLRSRLSFGMATPKSRMETGSLLRAIDGTHLKWNDFREDVLQPFGIKVANAKELDSVPPSLLLRLQHRLSEPQRFDSQREQWRDQVNVGQGFATPTVFPPNILPPVWYPAKTQRCLFPKISRETLPRRAKTSTSLFELPSSRPIYVTAFATEAFTEVEHSVLPSSLSPTGTVVDYMNGLVDSGRTLHCPFLTFERCQGMNNDDLEDSLNMCAISGAQCIRGLQEITNRAQRSTENLFSFTCVINDKVAILNIHTVDEHGRYLMSALYKFDLLNDDHFNTFQAWIEAIEEWATTSLLPDIKDLLTKTSLAGDTPPASPMPSLALSVDTEVGMIPGLMQALRKTYPSIAWKTNEIAESPINSSIAHCGTPFERRRSQGMLLGSPAASAFGELMVRRGKLNGALSSLSIPRELQIAYTPAKPSPFSPRYTVATPALDPVIESPCRPGPVSPYTPPNDQPWAAKSPILVLQKRFDVAMNEISDLRSLVEVLQAELSLRNRQMNERLDIIERLRDERQERENDSPQPTDEDVVGRCPSDKVKVEQQLERNWLNFSRLCDRNVPVAHVLFVVTLLALMALGFLFYRIFVPQAYEAVALPAFRIVRSSVATTRQLVWTWTNTAQIALPNLMSR